MTEKSPDIYDDVESWIWKIGERLDDLKKDVHEKNSMRQKEREQQELIKENRQTFENIQRKYSVFCGYEASDDESRGKKRIEIQSGHHGENSHNSGDYISIMKFSHPIQTPEDYFKKELDKWRMDEASFKKAKANLWNKWRKPDAMYEDKDVTLASQYTITKKGNEFFLKATEQRFNKGHYSIRVDNFRTTPIKKLTEEELKQCLWKFTDKIQKADEEDKRRKEQQFEDAQRYAQNDVPHSDDKEAIA